MAAKKPHRHLVKKPSFEEKTLFFPAFMNR